MAERGNGSYLGGSGRLTHVSGKEEREEHYDTHCIILSKYIESDMAE